MGSNKKITAAELNTLNENKFTITIKLTAQQADFLTDKLANTPCLEAGWRESEILRLIGEHRTFCPLCSGNTIVDVNATIKQCQHCHRFFQE